jgi:Tol biopolymer transport system component
LSLLAGALATAALGAVPPQSGHDLYQQALVKERAEGNLQEAIDLYERIVRDFPEDHALAAEALVQMGQCYEKLGKAEAQKAYERVIREYADQLEPLQVARTRLAALNQPPHPEMTVRKIWSDPTMDLGGHVSPDGRRLSTVDWETGDLAIRDLGKGQTRRITHKGTWEESPDFAMYSRWSPDGRQIAYDWWSPGHPSELRVIDLQGRGSRTLYAAPEGSNLILLDWSPDGGEILVGIQGVEHRRRLAAVALAEGTVRTIGYTNGLYPSDRMAEYSPDGRHILYSDIPSGDGRSDDVFVVSVDGRDATAIVDHPANDMALGWSPDGRWVLFLSDRTGSLDLWTVPVRDGKAAGPPRLLKSGAGRIVSLGFDDHGRYYYGTWSRARDVYTATLDPLTGRALSAPTRVVQRFQGLNEWPAYSRDGRRITYVSARGSLTAPLDRATTLCIRSLETGDERELPLDFQRLVDPHFSAGGRSVFVGGFGERLELGFYHIELETGEMSLIVQVEQEDQRITSYEITPDGQALLYSLCDKANSVCRLLRRDLDTGAETEVHVVPNAERLSIALSPDGKTLAFLVRRIEDATEAERTVWAMPASGGAPRSVHRFTGFTSRWLPLEFTSDGKHILMPQARDDTSWTLIRVPVDGGEPQELGLQMTSFGTLSAHPDGRAIAFEGRSDSRAAVWVVEDLLPESSGGER